MYHEIPVIFSNNYQCHFESLAAMSETFSNFMNSELIVLFCLCFNNGFIMHQNASGIVCKRPAINVESKNVATLLLLISKGCVNNLRNRYHIKSSVN